MFLSVVHSMLSGSGDLHPNAWVGAIMFPVMLAFGFGLLRFGRYLARDESRFLKDFLIRTLDAHEQN